MANYVCMYVNFVMIDYKKKLATTEGRNYLAHGNRSLNTLGQRCLIFLIPSLSLGRVTSWLDTSWSPIYIFFEQGNKTLHKDIGLKII